MSIQDDALDQLAENYVKTTKRVQRFQKFLTWVMLPFSVLCFIGVILIAYLIERK